MRLDGVNAGDIVAVDHRGRRFHAVVTDLIPGGLSVRPLEHNVNYFSCRAREVVAHWARRGRRRDSDAHSACAPEQLGAEQLEMDPAP